MDDPPKAHPCVQAGKMPALPGGHPRSWGMQALPGVASADRVDLPGETQNENSWPVMDKLRQFQALG